jgi:hypothetical protein
MVSGGRGVCVGMVFRRRDVSLSEVGVTSQILRRRPFLEVGAMRVGIRCSSLVVGSLALLVIALVDGCGAKHPPADGGDALAARTGARLGRSACDHEDQDTSHYLHTPLYRACAVSVKARAIANDVRPEFRATGRDRSCYSAVVQVAVDTLGLPEGRTARVVRSTDPGFAAAVLAIVPALRFEPARLGERRVRQLFELREVMVIRQGRSVFGGGPRRWPRGSAGSAAEAGAGAGVERAPCQGRRRGRSCRRRGVARRPVERTPLLPTLGVRYGEIGARYRFNQENTDSCQRLLSSAPRTQCPSFWNTSPSVGTPLRRRAVKSCRP